MQMMATNNVSCPVWMDWFHGGLQYQIEHHLYPDLPRHQLRAASSYVKPMCDKLGIRYHAPEFFQVPTSRTSTHIALRMRKKRLCTTLRLEKSCSYHRYNASGTHTGVLQSIFDMTAGSVCHICELAAMLIDVILGC